MFNEIQEALVLYPLEDSVMGNRKYYPLITQHL